MTTRIKSEKTVEYKNAGTKKQQKIKNAEARQNRTTAMANTAASKRRVAKEEKAEIERQTETETERRGRGSERLHIYLNLVLNTTART